MQAIQTKYFGPGNVKGARIVAKCAARHLFVSYDHALNVEGNHIAAAEALRAKLEWVGAGYGDLASGCLEDGSYAHVMLGRDGRGN